MAGDAGIILAFADDGHVCKVGVERVDMCRRRNEIALHHQQCVNGFLCAAAPSEWPVSDLYAAGGQSLPSGRTRAAPQSP